MTSCLRFVTINFDFAYIESKNMLIFDWILKFVKKYQACRGFNVRSYTYGLEYYNKGQRTPYSVKDYFLFIA